MKNNEENNILGLCIQKIRESINDASDEWETLSNIEKSLGELKYKYVYPCSDKARANIAKVFIDKINQEMNVSGDEWESISKVESYLSQLESEISPSSQAKKPKL